MPAGPISPLAYFFPDRATPELQRLHAELGSRYSVREAARLMKSFLPCHPPHHTTVRDRLGRIAERLEKDRRASGDPAAATPKGGLTVFLDGAHIRCRPEYQQRHLDLVVGKIEGRNMCRRFGLVVNATASPGNRMREELSGANDKKSTRTQRAYLVIGSDGAHKVGITSSSLGKYGVPVRIIRSIAKGKSALAEHIGNFTGDLIVVMIQEMAGGADVRSHMLETERKVADALREMGQPMKARCRP
jgi:hypothetical protein